MNTTCSIAEAQSNFSNILKKSKDVLIKLKKRGKTVAYIVSKEQMESILESFEIMCNPKAMKAIKDCREGTTKYYPLESLDEDF